MLFIFPGFANSTHLVFQVLLDPRMCYFSVQTLPNSHICVSRCQALLNSHVCGFSFRALLTPRMCALSLFWRCYIRTSVFLLPSGAKSTPVLLSPRALLNSHMCVCVFLSPGVAEFTHMFFSVQALQNSHIWFVPFQALLSSHIFLFYSRRC